MLVVRDPARRRELRPVRVVDGHEVRKHPARVQTRVQPCRWGNAPRHRWKARRRRRSFGIHISYGNINSYYNQYVTVGKLVAEGGRSEYILVMGT